MVKFPWDTICEPTSHTTRRFNGALNLVKNWRRRFECRRVSDQPRRSRTQLKCLEVVKRNTSSRIGRTATRFLSTTKVLEGINTSMVCIVRTHRHGLTIGHCRRLERGQALPLGSRVPPSRKVAHEGRYRTRNSLHMQVLLESHAQMAATPHCFKLDFPGSRLPRSPKSSRTLHRKTQPLVLPPHYPGIQWETIGEPKPSLNLLRRAD
jgi:hypothetical protein